MALHALGKEEEGKRKNPREKKLISMDRPAQYKKPNKAEYNSILELQNKPKQNITKKKRKKEKRG